MNSTQDYLDLLGLKLSHDQMTDRAEVIRSEINRLRQELSDLEVKLGLISKLIDLENRSNFALADEEPQRDDLGDSPAIDRFEAPSDDFIEIEVEAILEAAGSPMHISKIRNQLIERGVRIPGRGDDANIIVRLRKGDGRFIRTARGTYALPKWNLPSIDARRSNKSGSKK